MAQTTTDVYRMLRPLIQRQINESASGSQRTAANIDRQAADFVIYETGSITYAVDGNMGKISYSGTDRRTVIQAAIDASNTAGGGAVVLQRTYALDSPVQLKSGVTLAGTGWQSGLSVATDIVAVEVQSGVSGAVVRDMTITGPGVTGSEKLIYVDTASNVTVDNVQFLSYASSCVKLTDSSHCRVVNCRMIGLSTYVAELAGVDIAGGGGHQVLNNEISHGNSSVYGHGIALAATDNNTIGYNHIHEIGHSGINLWCLDKVSCNHNLIIGNHITDADGTRHASGIVIDGGTITGDGGVAVGNSVVGNHCHDKATNGITVKRAWHTEITGNYCSRNGSNGINLASDSALVRINVTARTGEFDVGEVVTGGTSGAYGTVLANGSGYNGVAFVVLRAVTGGPFSREEALTGGTSGETAVCQEYGSSNHVTISGNHCYDNGNAGAGRGIYVEADIHDVTISGNHCVGNQETGILVGGSAGRNRRISITGNESHRNGGHGCYILAASGKLAYEISISGGNIFSDNALAGLSTNYIGNFVICGNIITDNNQKAAGTQYGVRVAGSQGIVADNVIACNGYTYAHVDNININAVSSNVLVANNRLYGATGNDITDNGSNSVIRDNVGFETEVSAKSVSVADGASIAHTLAVTPTIVTVTPTVAGEIVAVTAITSTTFTVAIKKHDGTAGTTQDLYWRAQK